jgi:hypothetical protein
VIRLSTKMFIRRARFVTKSVVSILFWLYFPWLATLRAEAAREDNQAVSTLERPNLGVTSTGPIGVNLVFWRHLGQGIGYPD